MNEISLRYPSSSFHQPPVTVMVEPKQSEICQAQRVPRGTLKHVTVVAAACSDEAKLELYLYGRYRYLDGGEDGAQDRSSEYASRFQQAAGFVLLGQMRGRRGIIHFSTLVTLPDRCDMYWAGHEVC